jgi:hypothetical protein
MSELEANAETTVTLRMSEKYARKVLGSLGRTLSTIDKLDPCRRGHLVNLGTVDDLLSVKTAIETALYVIHGKEDK